MKEKLFNRFNQSAVYLEEHNHVYVHKETGYIYNSVTSALSLFKSEFDKSSVIQGLQNQYKTFINWYKKMGGTMESLPDILRLYVRYNKKRDFELRYFNGKENKVFKRLTQYSSIEELVAELIAVQSTTKVPHKAIYLKSDYTIMSEEEILNMWDVTNLLSRHYGHMIHESLEYFLLDSQSLPVDKFEKLKRIQGKFNDLKDLLEQTDKSFNEDFFNVYIINMVPFEFMEWIISKFKEVNPELGVVAIPEKVNFSPTYEICGTEDIEIILDEINFEIGDHKTNKQFTFESEYDKNLKAPFDDMPSCSMSDYTLQLNTYGLIQEVDYGRRFNGGWITYFDREQKKFDYIKIPVVLDKADLLLKTFKNHQDTLKEKFLMSGIFNGINPKFYNYFAKILHEDIESRRKKHQLDVNDKVGNRKHYQNFLIRKQASLLKYI